MFAPDNSRACENSWELLSSFLAGHFYYTVRGNAMANQLLDNRKSALVDYFQAALSAASASVSRPGQFLSGMWEQFFDYAKKSVPALKHETEAAFAVRIAQAYAPAEHVRAMHPQQVHDYALRAFMTVIARAHKKAIDYTDDILNQRETVVPAMQDAFNGLSRAHRLELGASLHSRGTVQVATPYDDAARHITELNAEVARLAGENVRLVQKCRELEMQRQLSPARTAVTASRTSNAKILALAQEQLRERERLAKENKRLRSALSSAQSTITSLQSDARTLLDAARTNIERYAKSMAPDDVLPSDSVSVAPRPAPAKSSAAAAESSAVTEMMSEFDATAFDRDFG
jgi:hypothetical protein